MGRLKVLAAVAIAVSMLVAGSTVAQQVYPTRTVRFILPFNPASASDITARLFADRLAARWNKPVVVENRPGGDGIVHRRTIRRRSSQALERLLRSDA